MTMPTETRYDLSRVLHPATIAFVGISDDSVFAPNAEITLRGQAEVFFVHPRRDEVFGRPAYRSVSDIGRPIDAVFTVTSAARTVEVAQDAADSGAGGLVTIAGGFAETGPEGAALQAELVRIAREARMPVIGPNGVGMANVGLGISLLMQAPFPRRVGGLSGIFHSGSMVEAIASAADYVGGVGFNVLISAGNEAVTDMADYLNALVDDPQTRVIALGIEAIRRPEAFFRAAERARRAGIPIIALKTGRSERSQRMAASHTGALVGDAWVYDVALRQAGIQIAGDVDELVQRAQFLERVPRERWSRAEGVAILATTGGFAQLASDLADEEGVRVPELPALASFVKDNIPGGSPVTNPLDATGFAWSDPELWERIVRAYAACDDVDVVWFPSQHGDWDEAMARPMMETFTRVASESTKPFIVSQLAGRPGAWLETFASDSVAIGDGFRSTLRGLSTMAAVVATPADARVLPASTVSASERPVGRTFSVPEGVMLGFAETMRLLEDAGISVARYTVLSSPDDPRPAFDGPYVVKLADMPHRTELGAVRLGVSGDGLPEAIRDLQAIAHRHGLPSGVAVQEMVSGIGEVFIGAQGTSELGPLVALGLGGIFVEVLHTVSGRIAPFDHAEAARLVSEFDRFGILDGFRGRAPWPREKLAETLVSVSRLTAAGREWIASMDLNPLIVTAEGVIAVDALCLLQE